jgi:transcription termination factor NusA
MPSKVTNISGIGSTTAAILSEHNFKSVESIAQSTVEELSAVPGFSASRADKIIIAARQLLDSKASGSGIDTDTSEADASMEPAKAESKKDKAKNKKTKGKKKKDKTKAKDKKKNKKNKKDKKNKKGK